jgi:hypothetical protein
VCFTTDDATLAALNGVLAAVEFEVDPATMSAAGTAYEWK